MTGYLQLHAITAVPPSCLNRDDTGRNKTCVMGGDPRLRLSSQSLKRAWRTSTVFTEAVGADNLGIRTRLIGEKIGERLRAKGVPARRAAEIVDTILDEHLATPSKAKAKQKAEKKAKQPEEDGGGAQNGDLKQLVFLSHAEEQRAYAVAEALANNPKEPIGEDAILSRADTAVDIGMFGRMFANNHGFDRAAAVQVAHGVTTHRVTVEDDYFTAVDDLQPHDETGAGHLNTQYYAAGVFYLYASVNIDRLIDNLDGNWQLPLVPRSPKRWRLCCPAASKTASLRLPVRRTCLPNGGRSSLAHWPARSLARCGAMTSLLTASRLCAAGATS
jgi:CRISPR system Cascade subunit CasC